MFQNHMWFHADQKFMWSPACYVVFPRIVCKFGDWKKLTPGRRLSRRPRSQVLFNPCIHSFRLPIGARVKGSGEILLDSKSFTHLFRKCRCEPGVAVRDNSFRKSEPRYEVFQILEGYTCSVDRFCAWNEFSCFGAALINDRENGVEAL